MAKEKEHVCKQCGYMTLEKKCQNCGSENSIADKPKGLAVVFNMKESEIALLKQTITSKIIENNTLKEELVKLQRQIEVLEEQLQEQITLRISLENNILKKYFGG